MLGTVHGIQLHKKKEMDINQVIIVLNIMLNRGKCSEGAKAINQD